MSLDEVDRQFRQHFEEAGHCDGVCEVQAHEWARAAQDAWEFIRSVYGLLNGRDQSRADALLTGASAAPPTPAPDRTALEDVARRCIARCLDDSGDDAGVLLNDVYGWLKDALTRPPAGAAG